MATAARSKAAQQVDDGQPLADAEVEAIAYETSAEEQDALAKSGLTKEEFRERRTKAYAAGAKRLREENLDKFRALVIEEGKKLGIDYVFQPTEKEKAAAKIAALVAEFPELANQLGK